MPVALFGITNDALNLVVNLLILFLVVLWLALVAWTYFDARRRLEDGFLVVCATACSLIFPFVGTIVYSILRPPEFLADKRERELEIRASELRVRQLEEQSCPNCEHPVERTLPALPELPRADQGPVRVLRQADRPALVDLPLLRDAGPPGRAARAPAVLQAPQQQALAAGGAGSERAAEPRSSSSRSSSTRPRADRRAARQPPSGEPGRTPPRRAGAPVRAARDRPAPRRARPSSARRPRASRSAAASSLPRRWRTPGP